MSVPKWLIDLGIPEKCISKSSSAHEQGRSFSIRPQKGEKIWRVKVDNCWLQDKDGKKVDYMFFLQSKSGKKIVLLLELKGQNLGKALQQVEAMLERLCKKSARKGIHTGVHTSSPGHDRHNRGGIRAVIVLSKGKKTRQRSKELARIQKRFGVTVHITTTRLEVKGVDALPK